MTTVIDASELVVGRLATNVAKRLLKGDEIVIVNAEMAVFAGRRDALINEFVHRREQGSTRKGPFYPRMPDRILRRAIRGMLPYRRSPGKDALHRLHVFVGVPVDYLSTKPETIREANKPLLRDFMHIGEISKVLGAKL
jgi:large subunit ribosomal protein L13